MEAVIIVRDATIAISESDQKGRISMNHKTLTQTERHPGSSKRVLAKRHSPHKRKRREPPSSIIALTP